MPILASDLVNLLGIGKKKKKKDTPAPAYRASAGDMLRSGELAPTALPNALRQNPGLAQLAPPPPPVIVAPPSMSTAPSAVQRAIEMALANLGGGPDAAAYSRPFDAAESRVRGAYQAALPTIAQAYLQSRGDIGQNQALANQAAMQAQQQQAAQAQAVQQNVAALQAPVLRDLAAQGGAGTNLMSGLGAAIQTGQSMLQSQQQGQAQLSQNLQNAANQSFQSRLQDSHLAEQAARDQALNTQNQMLGGIGRQRAAAAAQLQQDINAHLARQQELQFRLASLQDDQSQRQQAMQEPAYQLRELQATDALSNYTRTRNLPPVGARFREWSSSNPVATDTLRTIFRESTDYNDALSYVDDWAKDPKKGGKGQFIVVNGKRISTNWLRDRLGELKDYWG